MAQIGEGESVRYAGLLKGQLMETITLEEALDLFKFPRQLGEFEEKPVSVGIGRFGPYIKQDVYKRQPVTGELPYRYGLARMELKKNVSVRLKN